MIKLLFTSDYSSPNTYLKSIVDELLNFCEIVCGAENFWFSNCKFDIIHIQWPEGLFKNYGMVTTEDMEKFKERFEFWKKSGTKIVVTCHNEQPHHSSNEGKQLFEWLYKNADAVVHLGQYSKNKIAAGKSNRHSVIEHPNYNNVVDEALTKEKAREYLHIAPAEKLFISIGAMRFREEEIQLTEAYKTVYENNYGLMIRDSFLMKTPLSLFRQPGKRISKELQINKLKKLNVRFYSKAIPERELKYYLTACDVVISPRINSLNSGVIFLALSFGKPVVAPSIGNMKEIMEKTGNPVFIPNDNESFSSALKTAIKNAGDLGRNNKAFADTQLNPALIAKQHFELYSELIRLNPKQHRPEQDHEF